MARREWAGKKVRALEVSSHGPGPYVLPGDAAYLLAKEHARAVRVVKARDKWLLDGGYDNMSPDFQAGYRQACRHILAKLTKGRA